MVMYISNYLLDEHQFFGRHYLEKVFKRVIVLMAVQYTHFIDIFFFFSSRRRHTRSPRDWSSDVCSSDLSTCARCRATSAVRSAARGRTRAPRGSEERRVGKECRSPWSPYHSKKKKKKQMTRKRTTATTRSASKQPHLTRHQ